MIYRMAKLATLYIELEIIIILYIYNILYIELEIIIILYIN